MMLILDENKILSNMTESLASKYTKASYVTSLRWYMKFLKVEKYSDLLKIDVYESVKSFVLYLREKGYNTRTIDVRVSALKTFYEMNSIDIGGLKWKRLHRYRGEETDIHEDRAYTHEEIQQILNVASLRNRVAILLMCSSGMRIGALPTLDVRSVAQDCLTVYANTKHKYISFITPECRKAIDDYLEYRKRCGEKITPDSPLLRKDFDEAVGRLNVKPVMLSSLSWNIHKTLVRSGIRIVDPLHPGRRKEIMTNHGFRKFFKTQLVLAKVDSEIREMLMGHSKRRLEIVYNKLSTEEMYGEYSKAIDLLTIDPSKRLQRKVELLTVEKSKIDLALSEIAEMKKMITRKAS